MAKNKGQRIGILIIAAVMVIGTLGSFGMMMLSTQNEAIDQQNYEEQMAEYQRQLEDQAREQVAASQPLDGYSADEFDPDSVTELSVEVLEEGSGEKLEEDSTIEANYFGWTSDGSIFDSTNKNGEVNPAEFSLSAVIAGWTEGLAGVKEGSTVKLTIPADKAYGVNGNPPTIGPNEPLRFIVEVLEKK